MSEPIFRLAQKEDVPLILEMSKNRAELTELYTCVRVCGEVPYIGSLWVSASETGAVTGVAFDTGAYTLYHTDEKTRFIPRGFGLEASENIPEENDLIFMIYSGEKHEKKGFSQEQGIDEIKGKGLADIYRLADLSEKLSDCNEKRYLYNYLCSNKGFSRSYGFFEQSRLISTVSAGAVNESFALISNVFTLPLRRGEGLATALLEIAVKNALATGLVPVLVCEKRLTGFYEKVGFRINGGRL